MAYYDITAFDSITFASYFVKMVDMSENAAVVSRIAYLENGAKFDADATTDSDVTLGQVVARFQALPTSAGLANLNTAVAAMTGKRGHYGTLTGTQDAATKTCTARCVDVIEEDISIGGFPMVAAKKQRAFVTMVWEKLTEWA